MSLELKFPKWERFYFELFKCLLIEFKKQKEDDSTNADIIEFINEISSKDDGQLSKVYYSGMAEQNRQIEKIEVVLTTMHKVKGLEFDVVIIPASKANLELKEKDLKNLILSGITKEQAFKDYLEEERRRFTMWHIQELSLN